jgi:hypothetical protein
MLQIQPFSPLFAFLLIETHSNRFVPAVIETMARMIWGTGAHPRIIVGRSAEGFFVSIRVISWTFFAFSSSLSFWPF